MSDSDKMPAVTLKRRLRFWCLVLAVPAGVAFGQADEPGQIQSPGARPALADSLPGDVSGAETAVPADDGSFAEFVKEAEAGTAPVPGASAGEGAVVEARTPGKSRLKVGMSLEEALEVLGKTPDSQNEIGAACGKFDVLTWDEDGTRLISVDGTISSIYEGKQEPQE
jgi:hypothetical protein